MLHLILDLAIARGHDVLDTLDTLQQVALPFSSTESTGGKRGGEPRGDGDVLAETFGEAGAWEFVETGDGAGVLVALGPCICCILALNRICNKSVCVQVKSSGVI